MSYTFNVSERQRRILIAALEQFRIDHASEKNCNLILEAPMDFGSESDPDAESMLMAGMMQDAVDGTITGLCL